MRQSPPERFANHFSLQGEDSSSTVGSSSSQASHQPPGILKNSSQRTKTNGSIMPVASADERLKEYEKELRKRHEVQEDRQRQQQFLR